MTKINKLVLEGFKSFAKRSELVFGDEFNCVLGPNGSGKSNILDAICFVLGKGSAKALRTEKSANLIYNGGKSKSPAKDAEVSIYFDNSKKVFPIQTDEIKISRIIKPSGNSVYKINDVVSTKQNILDMMSIANIDPDGYNIILQGDIIHFVEMSSVEKRQVIEQVSGISIYEEKKQLALNELNKVEEKLKEADIILSERQVYLKDLKQERDQAQKFKDLNEKIVQNKATYLNIQIKKKEEEKKSMDEKISKFKIEFDKINDHILKNREKIVEKKEQVQKINEEIEQKGEKDQVKLQKEIEQLKVDLATFKTKEQSIHEEINKIKTRIEQLKINSSDVDIKLQKLNDEETQLNQTLKQTQTDLDVIDKKIEDFKKKHNMEDAKAIEDEIDALDKLADNFEKEILELRQKQQESIRNTDKIQFQIEGIDEKITKILELEKENKEQLESLKDKKTEFKKVTLELNTCLNDDSSLAAQLQNARSKVTHAMEQVAKLSARNASLQETISGDQSIKKIIEQKNKIPGIYGTISELGQVQSQYATALGTAAGNKLKSIVVEDDSTAAECIKYLKTNRFGSASFIPLNKIRSQVIESHTREFAKSGGAHGFAIELISFDEKFRKAFSHVFGSTLVVDNIDVARKIGIGQLKMVTLDGDLAEMSGVMQGGYKNKQQTSGFLEKEVSDEIKKYENQLNDSSAVVNKLQTRKQENEERINNLRNLKANLEGDIIKLEKSLNLDSKDTDANKTVKKELQEKLVQVNLESQKIGMEISKKNSELTQNKIKKQQLKAKINEVRNPTKLAELNAFEDKKQQYKGNLIKLEVELKSLINQKTNMVMPEKESIEKAIKQQQKEFDDFKAIEHELKSKITHSNKVLIEKEEKAKEFYKQYKELFDKRSKLSDEVTKLEGDSDLQAHKARDVELKMNANSLENARFNAEITGMFKEFEQYKDVELNQKTEKELQKEISDFEKMMAGIGNVNMKALEIYDKVKEEFDALNQKKKILIEEKEEVLVMMNEIDSKKKEKFLKTFNIINTYFKEIFLALSTKGEAELELENPEMPFEEGIRIRVRLTGTKYLDIKSLSGGEKTMTALAFIFAIQEHNPASFYVLDEVDAALDKKNSEKLALLIKKYSVKAQYVVISHNDGVISQANNLYGISMDEHGQSKVTTLKI